MAEWSGRWTRNSAVPGWSPALATCWICSWSSQVQILSCACKLLLLLLLLLLLNYLANWLPPASWGFKSCYLVFELFVSKYLSGVPVN